MRLYIFTQFHSFKISYRKRSIENNIQRKLPNKNMYYLSTIFACVHHQPTKSIIKNRIVAKEISSLFWSRLSHHPYQPTSPTKQPSNFGPGSVTSPISNQPDKATRQPTSTNPFCDADSAHSHQLTSSCTNQRSHPGTFSAVLSRRRCRTAGSSKSRPLSRCLSARAASPSCAFYNDAPRFSFLNSDWSPDLG